MAEQSMPPQDDLSAGQPNGGAEADAAKEATAEEAAVKVSADRVAQAAHTPLPAPRVTGILTAEDILEELKNGRLIKDGQTTNVQACSYDMRIGTIFWNGRIIKGKQAAGDQVLLEPSGIISVLTLEELVLPDDIAATAFAINAMSSEGILVLNPGHVDPGFKGPLSVKAINIRSTVKSIDLGTAIFTVIFERLPKPTTQPYDKGTDREERELKSNETDVEKNPKSLAKLVMLGENKPLMTGEEVDRRIMAHWMTWTIFIGTIITVALAAVAAIFAILGVYRTEPSKPVEVNTSPAREVSSPSPPPRMESPNSNSIPSDGNQNTGQSNSQRKRG
jgi:deoxycytidine triphosphate deaminase